MIINICSWNVNGLRAIKRKKALNWIDLYKPDILCLQETKLSSCNIPDLFNKKYSSIIVNNSNNKGFSGTLTFSDFKALKSSFCHNIDKECDGRIIEQQYNDLVILNIYIPNGKLNSRRLKIKLQFYTNLFKYCEQLRSQGKSIIICGDFNTAHTALDLKKSKIYNQSGFTALERSFLDNFISNGYLDSYRYMHANKEDAYTWWSYRSNGRAKNEGWRIDYILLSNDLKDKIQDAYILSHIEGSDHCPIGIKINLSNENFSPSHQEH